MFRKTIYGTSVQFRTPEIPLKTDGNSASVDRVLDSVYLSLIPLSSALSVRRKRRLGPSISFALRDDTPRYRWVDGEWVKR